MPATFRLKVALGFAIPIALMTASACARYVTVTQSESTSRWVVHTVEVIANGHELARTFSDAQATSRGESPANANAASTALDAPTLGFFRAVAHLEEQVADNPPQVARLRALVLTFERWRAAVARSTEDTHEASDAVAMAQTLRREIDDFIGVERSLLQQRLAANEDATKWSRLTTLVMPLFAVLTALVSALVFSGRIARRVRELAGAAEALAAGDETARRVPTNGSDELAALARAFNTMADRLLARARQSTLLNELGAGLSSCLTMAEAFDLGRRFLVKAAPGTSGALCLHNASRNLLDRAVSWGAPDALDETLVAADCLALRRGSEHVVADAATDPTCHHVHVKEGSVLCLPLLAHGETVGVLSIAAPRVDLTADAIALFRSTGEQLGLAFANLQLRERLQNQSLRDALTGLFNRRYLEETLTRELARARRANRDTGVLVFDVDHFKRFNDTFGHDAGDAVLRNVGAVLQASIRESDIACRYGGEEFVLVFFDVDLEGLVRRAERLREKVKEMAVSHGGKLLGAVTISVGAALAPLHGSTPETVMKAADLALYAAKGDGRDRVVLAASSTSSQPLHSVAPDALRERERS